MVENEFECFIEEESHFTSKGTENLFESAIPKQSIEIISKSNRITYKSHSGTFYTISLLRDDNYSRALFIALCAGLKSEWFADLSDITKPTYFLDVRKFINWLNQADQKSKASGHYALLKDYEAFILNEKNQKRSGLGCINKIIREGLTSPELKDNDIHFMETLLRQSKPVKPPESEPVTLTSWFSLPWLRQILGEKLYLQLESPQRILLSFRITVATTLLYLLEIRAEWNKSVQLKFDTTYKDWQYDWNRIALDHLGKFDSNGDACDNLTELLLLDIIKSDHLSYLKYTLSRGNSKRISLQKKYVIKGKSNCPWQKPVMFHPKFYTCYSPIEEQLAAWLIACEAIQPSDIQKLKTTDYAVEVSMSGKLIALECNYFKGRSGATKQTAILMAKDLWTKAFYRYIQGLPETSYLFKTNISQSNKMPGLGQHASKHNVFTFLFKIWNSPRLQKTIQSEIYRANGTSVFLDAILALESGSEPLSHFTKRGKRSSAEYRITVARALPSNFFSLTHIKNTAVHAGTDKYRDSDLINHHSHTSLTEKNSYLTDANKDFVNRAGRVTRLVLHDLQNTVYQPSVLAIQQAVYDRELRTRIVETTGTTDIEVHALDQPIDNTPLTDEILVPDNTDNALVFIHYIRESERMLPKLLAVRPDWVERTLIIQVEWMSRTLSRMRFAKAAEDLYKKLQPYLPPVFEHLLETIE